MNDRAIDGATAGLPTNQELSNVELLLCHIAEKPFSLAT
jgi:hypothetical protein